MVKNPLTNYDHHLGKVEKYINMKEAQKARKTDSNLVGPDNSRPERKIMHQAPRNGIPRPLLNYEPAKIVGEKDV